MKLVFIAITTALSIPFATAQYVNIRINGDRIVPLSLEGDTAATTTVSSLTELVTAYNDPSMDAATTFDGFRMRAIQTGDSFAVIAAVADAVSPTMVVDTQTNFETTPASITVESTTLVEGYTPAVAGQSATGPAIASAIAGFIAGRASATVS